MLVTLIYIIIDEYIEADAFVIGNWFCICSPMLFLLLLLFLKHDFNNFRVKTLAKKSQKLCRGPPGATVSPAKHHLWLK